ncbi:MAG: RDD family protein [Thermoleophilaceae bacterium]|nr:RDD family protein [Thermoleophilaceae bacterium]
MAEPPRRRALPLPARLLGTGARGAQRAAELAGIDELVEQAAEEAVIRALESQAFDHALQRVLEGPVVEEAVARALESPAVERAALDALDSELVDKVWERLLASDEVQKLVERIAEAPEVRAAVAAQGVGLVGDLVRSVQTTTRRLDTAAESVGRGALFHEQRDEKSNDAGPVTRLLAFVLDIAALNGGFLLLSAVIASLAGAFVGDGDSASATAVVFGAGIWITVGGIYFVLFWGLVGQTLGMRVVGIELESPRGHEVGLRIAVRRVIGLALAVIPFGLGLLGVFTDPRRRGWQDKFAGTTVAYRDISRRPAPWSVPASTADLPS